MSTLGDTKMHVGGYHEYTGRCSVHQRDTMSTPRDFFTNEKRPLPNFQDFCSSTFCDYAVAYVGLWNITQLLKISLSGSQSPDPNTFISCFIFDQKSSVSKCPVGMLQDE